MQDSVLFAVLVAMILLALGLYRLGLAVVHWVERYFKEQEAIAKATQAAERIAAEKRTKYEAELVAAQRAHEAKYGTDYASGSNSRYSPAAYLTLNEIRDLTEPKP